MIRRSKLYCLWRFYFSQAAENCINWQKICRQTTKFDKNCRQRIFPFRSYKKWNEELTSKKNFNFNAIGFFFDANSRQRWFIQKYKKSTTFFTSLSIMSTKFPTQLYFLRVCSWTTDRQYYRTRYKGYRQPNHLSSPIKVGIEDDISEPILKRSTRITF